MTPKIPQWLPKDATEILNDWERTDPDGVGVIREYLVALRNEAAYWRTQRSERQ